MLSFKPGFSLSSFTFIKWLFSSSSLSATRHTTPHSPRVRQATTASTMTSSQTTLPTGISSLLTATMTLRTMRARATASASSSSQAVLTQPASRLAHTRSKRSRITSSQQALSSMDISPKMRHTESIRLEHGSTRATTVSQAQLQEA